MPKNTGRADAKRQEIAERGKRVLAMRAKGMSLRAIAEIEGVSHELVNKDINRALEATRSEVVGEVENLRAIELERIDTLTAQLNKSLETLDDNEALDTKLKVIDRLTKLSQERAKLLGIYAPTKQEVTGANGGKLEIHIVYDDDKPDFDKQGEDE